MGPIDVMDSRPCPGPSTRNTEELATGKLKGPKKLSARGKRKRVGQTLGITPGYCYEKKLCSSQFFSAQYRSPAVFSTNP